MEKREQDVLKDLGDYDTQQNLKPHSGFRSDVYSKTMSYNPFKRQDQIVVGREVKMSSTVDDRKDKSMDRSDCKKSPSAPTPRTAPKNKSKLKSYLKLSNKSGSRNVKARKAKNFMQRMTRDIERRGL